MKKSFMLLLGALLLSCSSIFAQLCPGSSYDLSYTSTTTTYHYFSTDPTVMTIDSITGIAQALVPGDASIYARDITTFLGSSIGYHVWPLPPAFTGDNVLCVGGTTTLSNGLTGGAWMNYQWYGSSYTPGVARIDTNTGVITAMAPGTSDFFHYDTSGYCYSHFVVTVNPSPAATSSDTNMIHWGTSICTGSGISLTPGYTVPLNGTWSSSNPSVATVFAVSPAYFTGNVLGVSTGTANISYTYATTTTGCTTHARYKEVTVNGGVIGPITGADTICMGDAITLSDAVAGGTWTSGNPGIVSVGSPGTLLGTIVATAVSAGTATITYTTTGWCGGSYITATELHNVTILPLAVAATISGPSTLCPGAATALTASIPGGIFVCSDAAVSMDTYGNTTGMSAGTALISYVVSGWCNSAISTISITVPATVNAGMILGPSTLCAGSSIALTDSVAGGTWSTSMPTTATIDAAGNLYGSSAGTASVTYTVSGLCNTASTSAAITVLPVVATGTISGATTVVAGSSAGMVSSVSGGTWSASPLSVATIDPVIGVLSAVSAGTATVSYTVTGCGGPVSATYTVTVTAAPTTFDGISGTVNFNSGAISSNVKVWLIDYAAPTLTAVDSTIINVTGTSGAYQFAGIPTGNYRIKAAIDPTSAGTGYMPTYHANSFYWSTATVVNHSAGTADVNKDIDMGYGSVTSGAGFIGGDVTTGANKGTASSIPAVGLNMYLFNTSSSTPLQMTKTDAAGHYSFGNLPVGVTYYVFPEALNYTTIPYSGIGLTTANPSITTANFVQRTVSHIITPSAVGVVAVTSTNPSVYTFPNPSTGKVNITWQLPSAQDATVTVSDITGRQVYTATFSMVVGSGTSTLDFSSLVSGQYIIAVKSADIDYVSKLQIQH